MMVEADLRFRPTRLDYYLKHKSDHQKQALRIHKCSGAELKGIDKLECLVPSFLGLAIWYRCAHQSLTQPNNVSIKAYTLSKTRCKLLLRCEAKLFWCEKIGSVRIWPWSSGKHTGNKRLTFTQLSRKGPETPDSWLERFFLKPQPAFMYR
ncbi:hypothetical protein METBIDRAFT_155380 [Metschnikowia bicuspidata var. bicuspidata NRRL YB-4993]|uniref:Uncharacterized protein n=1 Tax=Metschnikowia bicuspidata var. bicuspidata NRRL YB-4993 TaxID=869754 RepID=A0A1A0HF81_9ASCO|nr:hypothetical protein METBIDRAFT_155380 [Metschnikowia bicuspidata var. bicuspidata NRRL YB-4993]OBA22543.1 hypothetical protein METBIDRAFT_155380 [Metschnikowia bicuspidata var. bicuspidata NRRL YB-4993]